MPSTSSALRRWLGLQPRAPAAPGARSMAGSDAPPLRAELLNAEQMEARGRALARIHRVKAHTGTDTLIARLRENEALLAQANLALTTMVRDKLRITPAGEWFLDNFHLIEEQVRTARLHLPKGYSRQLPVLVQGGPTGLPRVYHLALEAVAHGDGWVDTDTMRRFISAYQEVEPLRLGELWAVPIMLRLAILENLRRMAAQVIRDGEDRRLAGEWATRLAQVAATHPKDLVLEVAEMARTAPPVSGSFVATLARGLQGRSVALAMPMAWLEHWAQDAGHGVEALIQAESQQQAVDQVSVSNSISSLRFLAQMDWRDFVESISAVDQSLREDPAGVYGSMDFLTRDHYRHVVERLARLGGMTEVDVARVALDLAHAHPVHGEAQAHVGYYLVDDGLPELREALRRANPASPVHLRKPLVPLPAYLLPIAFLTGAFTLGLLTAAIPPFAPGFGWVVLAVLAAIVFSELAIALVNWAATLIVVPRPLPRMDFSRGIPADCRSLVVVPCMFGSCEGVDTLVEALEVRYLANRDAHVQFALLSDFLDDDVPERPEDAALLKHGTARIDELNRSHARDGEDRFFLLHRPRTWNASEGKWIGSERKRGKLAALNALLLTGHADAFMRIAGNPAHLAGIRYVITLDADTRLPRDAARELVATLAHPLNRAQCDPTRRRVARGYAILQPGVGSSMGASRSSRYALLLGSEPGIDPYTRAVSDVYQDLFGEGSFVGKGIYDVEAFEQVLDGRFLENRILSHDLLEGCQARAGLVSDIKLYEDYPARYAADVSRRHRWIRGDWQLLPWLLPWIRRLDGTRERNPLSMLSKGKLVDNLRRSLVPAATTLLLVTGWVLLERPLAWTLWLLCLWLLPVAVPTLRDVLAKPLDLAPSVHLRQVARSGVRQLKRAAVALACLPHEAWYSVDAIARTLWRVAVSRRNLLQWCPSSEAERRLRGGLAAELRRMWAAPAIATATFLAVALVNARALPVAVPILALWLASPWLMHWLSEPLRDEQAPLAPGQHAFLRRLARRTWGFFEVHVTEAGHFLPPDNVQEHPTAVVAHRTSPTNIGLSLLANLAAYDLGYLTVGGVIERSTRTLDTLDRLARHRGHFFNWYDTRTLEPLHPRYVSSVDSGNLVGHLLTLRQGLLALADAPALPPALCAGLSDTLAVLREELAAVSASAPALAAAIDAFATRLDSIQQRAEGGAWRGESEMLTLRGLAVDITRHAPAPAEDGDLAVPDWPAALVSACEAARAEAARLAPGSEDGQRMSLRQLARLDPHSPTGAWARERLQALHDLAERANHLSLMEQAFLYDPARHLVSIGYNVDENHLDAGFYDLLASEARLGTFVAIARGQLPQESWFALGRLLTEVEGQSTLLSWSGSMFEYLMPELVMPSYPGTLLHQTLEHAVSAQIRYCTRRGVPWGVSESGYNAVDAAMNYQYRAFGVPGLGLKRGLSQDLVIAPYASMMALAVAPGQACRNLQRLHELGFAGHFGLYEAVDYTPERLPQGHKHAVVRSFMAHHQGMGLLGLVHLLCDQPMQRRFVADPEVKATLLLLQERIPRTAVFHPHRAERDETDLGPGEHPVRLRILHDPDTPRPAVQLLSNGRYHVLMSSAGAGYSRLRDIALTRWREDATRDPWGSFCYLRDVASGEFWSATHQPTCVPLDGYEAIFTDAKAEFRGRRAGLESHLEIAVSSEDDIELRRLVVYNRSRVERTIEITTYAEVVLAPALADEMHPAFSNLFVQTRIVREKQAVLCTRRARSHGEVPPVMFHLIAVHEADVEAISYETDRASFIGRTRTLKQPRALTDDETLGGSEGSVLDPIVAIRCRVRLKPEQSVSFDLVTGVGTDEAAGLALIDKYRDRRLANRVFELAWTQSQVVRRQINASQADAQLYERLAGLMVYANPLLRARAAVLQQNRRGQSGLWGQAISGDLPIALVRIADVANIELVRQMIQAHAYWRLKGLETDLVIWNEDRAIYRQHLQDRIMGMVSAGPEPNALDRPGGIFVRSAHQIQQEDRILLKSVARVIVSDRRGTLGSQLAQQLVVTAVPPGGALALAAPAPASAPARAPDALPAVAAVAADATPTGTLFDNGLGAFAEDSGEYVVTLEAGDATPAPWCNVLANPGFGTVLSESSLGYTWFENAHEFRLSPWHNDPVCDASGEAIYLHDEASGRAWSPTPLPRRGPGRYTVRHGFGYTVYQHVCDGIESELRVHVALGEPVKFMQLVLRNRSNLARRISVTGYVEWVLGDVRARSHMHVISATEPGSGVLIARNRYNTEFTGRVAFFAIDAGPYSFTTDRAEFLGRNGDVGAPAALDRPLSGRIGVGTDPCAALRRSLELPVGGEATVVFRLGAARSASDAMHLAQHTRPHASASAALDEVRAHWTRVLGTVQVSTPEADFDVLANGWLMYQTLGCRYAARSGFYQSGGAFGFRDQLQDTMATVHAEPGLSRQHLLLCASKQFPQGDVLHWWHPPSGRGVRTRCSDDYLWLPVATCRYLDVTGDSSILEETAGFLEGRPVNVDEESYYDLPAISDRTGTLYEHCVLALRRGTSLLGARGLPLIGTGDWNDGMNRVGEAGVGESVWLGFFLHRALREFARVATRRGDDYFATQCAAWSADLARNLEAHGWDGEWYRRAWFDDGTPLGASGNTECRIDSIAQSWSVLSGVAPASRARQAMKSLATHLVKPDARLVQLLDPPFDRADPDPGYIRGYVPGVRENGGQYTHAAVWAAMAFAELGDARSAWALARMINPVNHTRTAPEVARYRVEPYVMAADVYAVPPHTGRGGWTWYTGSAGWMYRMMIESLLGLHRSGDMMRLHPCVPSDWPGYRMDYRQGGTLYRIRVELATAGVARLELDGVAQDSPAFALVDDGQEHQVMLVWPAHAERGRTSGPTPP